MELTLTTPALLFPAISLLLLAYTNRFLALATLVRSLHERYQQQPDDLVVAQIANLRYRIRLIRAMQVFGVTSFFLCVLCMFGLFAGWAAVSTYIFGTSLILLMLSLALSVLEVSVSVDALNYQLHDIEVTRSRRPR